MNQAKYYFPSTSDYVFSDIIFKCPDRNFIVNKNYWNLVAKY